MNEEKKPLCTCTRIGADQMAFTPEVEAMIGEMFRRAVERDRLQAYRLVKLDDPEQTRWAFYAPNDHTLVLFEDGRTQWAKDIPSMAQFLRWWLFEPETWKEHLFVPNGEQKP